MTDLTTDVTVTIHGTEIELVAKGGEICPAEPDVGIMYRSIEEWELHFADGTPIPEALENRISYAERLKVMGALDEALARGDFE